MFFSYCLSCLIWDSNILNTNPSHEKPNTQIESVSRFQDKGTAHNPFSFELIRKCSGQLRRCIPLAVCNVIFIDPWNLFIDSSVGYIYVSKICYLECIIYWSLVVAVKVWSHSCILIQMINIVPFRTNAVLRCYCDGSTFHTPANIVYLSITKWRCSTFYIFTPENNNHSISSIERDQH